MGEKLDLFKEIMYSHAKILKYHNQFYGKYERYNNLKIPTLEEIKNYQFDNLEKFQQYAFKENDKIKLINNFLMPKGKFNSKDDDFSKNLNKILKNINDMVVNKKVLSNKYQQNLDKNKKELNYLSESFSSIAFSLSEIMKQDKQNGTINSRYIKELYDLINNISISKTQANNYINILNHIFHLQGDILEQVGTLWFSQKIPQQIKVEVKAYTTGAIANSSGQQLIQDILVFNTSKNNTSLLENISITYQIGKKEETKSLKDFLETIEGYSGEELIKLSDKNYKTLLKNSLLGIQAKSGQNQLPWNERTKNTFVPIIEKKASKVDEYYYFLHHMHYLYYNWGKINNGENKDIGTVAEENMKKRSIAYSRMADYKLAELLNKVLHLSQKENQYVLTPNGFMTFTDRIKELYLKFGNKGYYFHFTNIRLDEPEFLTKKRPVTMLGKK